MPVLNKTDLALLKAMDEAVKLHVVDGADAMTVEQRAAYLMARHEIEFRLRRLCRCADLGYRARHVLSHKLAARAALSGDTE